jgi:ATP-dependent RNA helicase DeaD
VREVVLDEADQMLDMGFREDLDAIVDALPAERRSHLVSATFPVSVKRLAERFQSNALQLQGTALGKANLDIEHIAHVIYEEDRYKALVNVLLSHQGERALVFVRKRSDAAEVAEELANEGFAALPLSGDMAQAQRQRALAAFKSGTVQILIATDVAARGIHVDDIAVVIHTDIPTDSEIYTHRSGRTGRAGNKGSSVMLVPARGERRAQRVLRDANVTAIFAPLPSPKKILQRIVKDTRRKLHERLLQERELPHAEYAGQLLQQHPPELIVATLLEMAQAPLPREPFELDAPATQQRESRPQSNIGYTQFLVSWGMKAGANVNRLLSHVCRRSGLDRNAFGVIDVGPVTSTVDVRNDFAADFEGRVAVPDERDPNVRITRSAGQATDRRPPQRPRSNGPREHGGYPRDNAGPRPEGFQPRKLFGGASAGHRPAPAAGGAERRPPRPNTGHLHAGPKRDHRPPARAPRKKADTLES